LANFVHRLKHCIRIERSDFFGNQIDSLTGLNRIANWNALTETMPGVIIALKVLSNVQHLHHPGDQCDNPDSAALQRPPNDLGLLHGAMVCSQTKQQSSKREFSL